MSFKKWLIGLLMLLTSASYCFGSDNIDPESLASGDPEKDLAEARKIFRPDVPKLTFDNHDVTVKRRFFKGMEEIDSYYQDEKGEKIRHGLCIRVFHNTYNAFLYRNGIKNGFHITYKEKPVYSAIRKGYFRDGKPFSSTCTYVLFEKKAAFLVMATYRDGRITRIVDFNDIVILENSYNEKGNLIDGYEIMELPPDRHPYDMKMKKYIGGKCVSEISASELYTREQRESSDNTYKKLVGIE